MELQQRFNDFYTELSESRLDALAGIYHPKVIFEDPVGTHEGLPALASYFRKLLKSCVQCEFVIRHQQFSGADAWLNWTMIFSHKRLNGGDPIHVDGGSVLRIREGRVVFQRDYYDMGSMVYEQIPVLGRLIRWLRRRMAA